MYFCNVKFYVSVEINVGPAIKKLIEERDISQKSLAEKIGRPPSQVNKWLRGRNEIGINSIIKIADALEMTIDELVGRKFNPSLGNEPDVAFKKSPEVEIEELKIEISEMKDDLALIKKVVSRKVDHEE